MHDRRVVCSASIGRLLVLGWSAVLFLAFSLQSPVASAAGKSRSSAAREKAAKKACLTGDVKTGIDILADLYVEIGDANYIFNQARCFEQNHRWEDAVDRFREYKRKAKDITDAERIDVDKHIADCEAFLAKPAPAEASAKAAPGPSPSPVAIPETPQATVAVSSSTAASAPSVSNGGGLRVSGGVVAGLGVAAIATGVVLAMKERSLTDELNVKYSQSKDSTRSSYETWGYVSYAVGAAAVLTGATLYYLGWRSAGSSGDRSEVALLPLVTPSSTTLALTGSF